MPQDPEELVTLPGIGRYTAGAVATFAYERAVPAVDTNVARVIRRVFFGREKGEGRRERYVAVHHKRAEHRKVHLPSPFAPALREIWSLATAIVPKSGKRAWRFNQAIMELGALVCTARKPKCPECAVRPVCRTGKVSAR